MPVCVPPTIEGLPGPTAEDLVLAARPNGWADAPSSAPATSLGPACRRAQRRRQAAPPSSVIGARDGAAAHLQDVAKWVLEELTAAPPSTMAHCWAKACILPLSMKEASLAEYDEYRLSSRTIADDVREIIDSMSTCPVAQKGFGEGDATEKELVVEAWLGLEEGIGAIEDTVELECTTERASKHEGGGE